VGVAAVLGDHQPLLIRTRIDLAEHAVPPQLARQSKDGAGVAVAEYVECWMLVVVELPCGPALKPGISGDGARPSCR
jgi:hypothetical protein